MDAIVVVVAAATVVMAIAAHVIIIARWTGRLGTLVEYHDKEIVMLRKLCADQEKRLVHVETVISMIERKANGDGG